MSYQHGADPILDRKRSQSRRAKGRRNAQHKRRGESAPEFIGVDGEGLSVPDGERQPYVLLAASTGEYVEDYDGLSSHACLHFLCKLQHENPRARLVVFSGGYDMTQFLADMPADVTQRLAETGETEWAAFKNGTYFLRMFPGKLLKVLFHAQHPTQPKSVRLRFTLYDVFGYFQTSFVNTLHDWGIGTDDARARVERMKEQRHHFETADRDAIRAYCFEETRLLRDLMREVGRAIHDVPSMPMTYQWHGAGALADALLRDRYMADALAGPPLPAAVERAYYGGRIETTRAGRLEPPLYEYDINSAYPHALKQLPPLSGDWRECDDYKGSAIHSVWSVAWDVRKHPVGARFGPFPVRRGTGLWWPATGMGSYLGREVAAAIEIFGDAIEVRGGWAFAPRYPEGRPWAWIPLLYDERRRLKARDERDGTNRNKPVKLALNALYGKTAQRGNWRLDDDGNPELRPGRWRNLYAAGWQTAYTRAALLRAAAQHPDSVVAFATDALITTRPLDVPRGDSLGEWSETIHNEPAMLVQPGFLVPLSGTMKRRTRGGLHSSLGYDAFSDAWDRDGINARVLSPDTRFIGLRLAAGLGDVEQRGRWITRDREITFYPDRRTPGRTRRGYVELDPVPYPPGTHEGFESEPVELPTGAEALIRWGLLDTRL